ncbi:MAG: hypothetical protein AAGE84_23310 [Cyanobacteria bacterium P01_G01_bin.39]
MKKRIVVTTQNGTIENEIALAGISAPISKVASNFIAETYSVSTIAIPLFNSYFPSINLSVQELLFIIFFTLMLSIVVEPNFLRLKKAKHTDKLMYKSLKKYLKNLRKELDET